MLDGEELRRDESDPERLLYADGRPVDPARYDDVVYASAPPAPAPALDVTSLLLTIADAHRPADPAADVDAGFFHRTLRRWMGLSPDDEPAAARTPEWDYGFWKAELHEEGELQHHAAALAGGATPTRVSTWCAVVWRGEAAEPERYRYWVATDTQGFIQGSGWLTSAPDLLGDSSSEAFRASTVDEVVAALLADADR